MRSIGQSLTDDGDILFYGCNVASTEGGKTLINKISEITKADIAASDDVTGKSGDWKLESKVGNIETKNISQVNYIHDLAMTRTENQQSKNTIVNINLDGITHIRGAMAAFTGTTDRNAFDFTTSKDIIAMILRMQIIYRISLKVILVQVQHGTANQVKHEFKELRLFWKRPVLLQVV